MIKEEPLKPTSCLKDVAKTQEDILGVLVPPTSNISKNYYMQILPSSFPPCRIPFFNNISDAKDEGNFLVFNGTIPGFQLNRLYSHKMYKQIAEQINLEKQLSRELLALGKLGLFLLYLLWKLDKDRKYVLFICHPFKIYFHGKGGVFDAEYLPRTRNTDFWNKDLWYFLDDKEKRDLSQISYGLCTIHHINVTKSRTD